MRRSQSASRLISLRREIIRVAITGCLPSTPGRRTRGATSTFWKAAEAYRNRRFTEPIQTSGTEEACHGRHRSEAQSRRCAMRTACAALPRGFARRSNGSACLLATLRRHFVQREYAVKLGETVRIEVGLWSHLGQPVSIAVLSADEHGAGAGKVGLPDVGSDIMDR